jgi:hypothetical protein
MVYMKYIIFFMIFHGFVLAKKLEVLIPGVSVHFGSGASESPRKLDNEGVYVFNPGIGANYDFRSDEKKSGFSIIVSGLYFKTCPDTNAFLVGAGVRGRYCLTDKISACANLIPSVVSIEGFSPMILPAITTGINYHITEKNDVGLTFAYVPGYDGGSDIGFFVLSVSF